MALTNVNKRDVTGHVIHNYGGFPLQTKRRERLGCRNSHTPADFQTPVHPWDPGWVPQQLERVLKKSEPQCVMNASNGANNKRRKTNSVKIFTTGKMDDLNGLFKNTTVFHKDFFFFRSNSSWQQQQIKKNKIKIIQKISFFLNLKIQTHLNQQVCCYTLASIWPKRFYIVLHHCVVFWCLYFKYDHYNIYFKHDIFSNTCFLL